MRGKQLYHTSYRIFHVCDFLGCVLALKYTILTPELHATYPLTFSEPSLQVLRDILQDVTEGEFCGLI